jgi:rhamnosyltransferase
MNQMLPDRVSMVMRSYNEAWALEGTLRMVFDQDYAGGIELIVIDSGSTDGSIEIFQRYNPAQLVQIESSSYVPGKVLNDGLRRSTNEWVVFLNADATPADRHWLSELLKVAVQAESPGTAFSRQVPRPDCEGVFAHDYDRCFGPERESARWPHFFSMVSCIVHRPTWEKVQFREDLQYAEDHEWSLRLKESGGAVDYADQSLVVHSHNYTPAQAYKRAYGDSKASAATAASKRDALWSKHVLMGFLRDIRADWRWLGKKGRRNEIRHAAKVRWQQRLGRYHGFHDGWKAYKRDEK